MEPPKTMKQRKREREFNRHFEALREAHIVPIYMDGMKRIKAAIETRIGPDMTDTEKDELLACLLMRLRGYLTDYAWAKINAPRKAKGESTYQIETVGT